MLTASNNQEHPQKEKNLILKSMKDANLIILGKIRISLDLLALRL